jgi:hypothetical protein
MAPPAPISASSGCADMSKTFLKFILLAPDVYVWWIRLLEIIATIVNGP